jgi:murein DD-endopeptidase MepM/ murein hydrolase activator NlpD
MNNPKLITAILTAMSLLAACSSGKTEPLPAQANAPAKASLAKETATPVKATVTPKASATDAAAVATEKAQAPLALALSSSAPPGLAVTVEPKVIERGSPCLFAITAPEALSSLNGSLMGKKVFFNPDQSRKAWYGLAGVGLESPLGRQTITLKGSDANGRPVTFSARFEIEARKTNIRVPPEFTNPDDEEKARTAREAILKREVFKTLSTEALWNGSFLRPVSQSIRLTAAFAGTRRFNSGPVKSHRGTDFGAPQGAPIKAMNSGRVILARNLFYDGNIVTIDHGQGLLSLYLHLSKINVKEGATVGSGQVIGLSGSTGRASGPHLHLQVKWEGIDIDPVELISLKVPSNLAKNN